MPVVGRAAQPPAPPAQFWKPDSMREIPVLGFSQSAPRCKVCAAYDLPIRHTVGPVTSGGKILRRYFGGVKDMRISSKAQQHAVPRMAP